MDSPADTRARNSHHSGEAATSMPNQSPPTHRAGSALVRMVMAIAGLAVSLYVSIGFLFAVGLSFFALYHPNQNQLMMQVSFWILLVLTVILLVFEVIAFRRRRYAIWFLAGVTPLLAYLSLVLGPWEEGHDFFASAPALSMAVTASIIFGMLTLVVGFLTLRKSQPSDTDSTDSKRDAQLDA